MSWFGRWLGMYFDFKSWKRDDTTYGGVRKFKVNGFEDGKADELKDEIPF